MKAKQQGFTIIELTIATAVFSVIILVVTAGVISFTNYYIKGLNQSKTQQTARSVLDQLSQSLQFAVSPNPPATSGNWHYYCVNNMVYSWQLKKQMNDANSNDMGSHALVRSPEQGSSCAVPTSFNSSQDTELLGKGMWLYDFTPTSSDGRTWDISIAVSYGDNDLLNTDGSCKTGTGSQYCASTSLKTSVQSRL